MGRGTGRERESKGRQVGAQDYTNRSVRMRVSYERGAIEIIPGG